ncbi:MAG: hypothetical protein GY793_06870 [Proteobacteria bacterium]|nr:hypothetical protein [Pseudomonadota bacterium]
MDFNFIARAGSLVDRGHRIIGILLFVLVLQFMWNHSIMKEKQVLQDQIDFQNRSQSIYVVPDSQAGVYKPETGNLLLSTFVDHLIQSLLTYTPANFKKQYDGVRLFLSSDMLSKADRFYKLEIRKSKRGRISSLFMTDKTSTELSNFIELPEKTSKYGEKVYSITVRGVRNMIVAGRVLEENKMSVKLQLKETAVSTVNPFGFKVTKMELIKAKSK